MRIHFGYEMPHDTACKQIICMWGKKTALSLQPEVVAAELLKQMPPTF